MKACPEFELDWKQTIKKHAWESLTFKALTITFTQKSKKELILALKHWAPVTTDQALSFFQNFIFHSSIYVV